jgi:hypothetical protein
MASDLRLRRSRNTAGAPVGFFIEPTTITEGVALSVTDFNTTATLGAADATVDFAGVVAEGGRRAARADLDGRGRCRVRRGDGGTGGGSGPAVHCRERLFHRRNCGEQRRIAQPGGDCAAQRRHLRYVRNRHHERRTRHAALGQQYVRHVAAIRDRRAGRLRSTHVERLATVQRHGDGVAPSRSVVRHHAGGQRLDPISQ